MVTTRSQASRRGTSSNPRRSARVAAVTRVRQQQQQRSAGTRSSQRGRGGAGRGSRGRGRARERTTSGRGQGRSNSRGRAPARRRQPRVRRRARVALLAEEFEPSTEEYDPSTEEYEPPTEQYFSPIEGDDGEGLDEPMGVGDAYFPLLDSGVPEPVDRIRVVGRRYENPDDFIYANRVSQLDDHRRTKTDRTSFLNYIRHLPPGFALVSGGLNESPTGGGVFSLIGYTLREIAQMIRGAGTYADGARMDLSSLYLSAVCYDFHSGVRFMANRGEPTQPGAIFTTGGRRRLITMQEKQLFNICLSDIRWPFDETFDEAYTENQGILEMINNFSTSAITSDVGGSDIATFVMYSQIRIERRAPYPDAGSQSIRTGGFEKFLLSDYQLENRSNGHWMYVPGGISRIKNKMLNCVLQCLHQVLKDRTWPVYIKFFVEWLEDRKKHCKKFNERNARASWNRMITQGFSAKILNRFILYLRREQGIDFRMFKVDASGRRLANCSPAYQEGWTSAVKISCAQIRLDGQFHGVSDDEQYNKLPGLLHCVRIGPDRDSYDLSSFRTEGGEPLARRVLDEASREISSDNYELSIDKMKEIVNYQAERKKGMDLDEFRYGARTFERDREEEIQEIEGGGGEGLSMSYSFVDTKEYAVAVYDLETVDNLTGCQDKVWERIRRKKPEGVPPELLNAYVVPEAQIPYSVQWGLVNMDGGGCWAAQHPWEQKEILINSEVHIEYGGNLLGKCVSDFLFNLASKCCERGIDEVFCYAHNGCGFDSYFFLRCNVDYKIEKILVTPRGILNLTIAVPIEKDVDMVLDSQVCQTRETKMIKIHLRDTKVFFQAKLSELCKVFRVPEEFRKVDFPIVKVHARNYDVPEVRSSYHAYVTNDIWCLAFIVVGINDIIEKEVFGGGWKTKRRLITKFVTAMSMVTKIQRDLFVAAKLPRPLAIELPALRKWINYGNVGGRVMPFWRGYESSCWAAIQKTVTEENDKDKRAEALKIHYRQVLDGTDYGIVLDVTSEYPYVMADYPMPIGNIYFIGGEGEYQQIRRELDCDECFNRRMLCPNHLPDGKDCLAQWGFYMFWVKDVTPPVVDLGMIRGGGRCLPHNICPRKTKKGALIYDFRSYAALKGTEDEVPAIMFFTQYDLFWMEKVGWTFTILGGVRFGADYVFRDSIYAMYQKRIEAKRREASEGLPKSLSTMWKNLYNGGYGINARKDILKQFITADSDSNEANLRRSRRLKPDEGVIRDASTHQLVNSQWLVHIEKYKDACEFFAGQSPNQIGAAVVSGARHHMNLLIFGLPSSESYGYTDTDSIFIKGKDYQFLKTNFPHLINDSAEAPLGTYKNDHEAPGEVVVRSMFLAKKVKLHITLDEKGVLRFHNTFKGYNPKAIDDDGNVRDAEEICMDKVKALGEIYFHGALQGDRYQTEFRRSVHGGIVIDRNSKFSGAESTFYGFSCGSFIRQGLFHTQKDFEVLVPLCDNQDELTEEKVLSGDEGGSSLKYYDYTRKGKNSYTRRVDLAENELRWDVFLDTIDACMQERFEKEKEKAEYKELHAWDEIFKKAPALAPEDYVWGE